LVFAQATDLTTRVDPLAACGRDPRGTDLGIEMLSPSRVDLPNKLRTQHSPPAAPDAKANISLRRSTFGPWSRTVRTHDCPVWPVSVRRERPDCAFALRANGVKESLRSGTVLP
jgi:hypothetical protein